MSQVDYACLREGITRLISQLGKEKQRSADRYQDLINKPFPMPYVEAVRSLALAASIGYMRPLLSDAIGDEEFERRIKNVAAFLASEWTGTLFRDKVESEIWAMIFRRFMACVSRSSIERERNDIRQE